MKVRELIEQLQGIDPELRVGTIVDVRWGEWEEAEEATVDEDRQLRSPWLGDTEVRETVVIIG